MGRMIKKETFEKKLKKKKRKRKGKNVTLEVDNGNLGFADFWHRRKPKPRNKGEGKEN